MTKKATKKTTKKITPEARERMSEGQRKRWASRPSEPAPAPPAPPAPSRTPAANPDVFCKCGHPAGAHARKVYTENYACTASVGPANCTCSEFKPANENPAANPAPQPPRANGESIFRRLLDESQKLIEEIAARREPEAQDEQIHTANSRALEHLSSVDKTEALIKAMDRAADTLVECANGGAHPVLLMMPKFQDSIFNGGVIVFHKGRSQFMKKLCLLLPDLMDRYDKSPKQAPSDSFPPDMESMLRSVVSQR